MPTYIFANQKNLKTCSRPSINYNVYALALTLIPYIMFTVFCFLFPCAGSICNRIYLVSSLVVPLCLVVVVVFPLFSVNSLLRSLIFQQEWQNVRAIKIILIEKLDWPSFNAYTTVRNVCKFDIFSAHSNLCARH